MILQKNSPISNIEYVIGNIALSEADVVINASNGCGSMGGKRCIKALYPGVAQSLQFYSKGMIEKESLIKARKHHKISSWIFGHKPGSIFVTGSANLKCKEIVHAVTMRYPGSKSSYKAVKQVMDELFKYCISNNHHSIALPLLGCGTGRLNSQQIIEMIENYALTYRQIKITVYMHDKPNNN